MKKLLQKRLNNEKGLTLVELLAVIVILGIIAAIAIPSIGNIIENSKYNAAKADAINVLNAANMYFVDTPAEVDVDVTTLKTDGFLENEGKIPVDSKITKANPNALTATVTYSGTKIVTFTNATIKSITDDIQKGSADSLTAITAP